MGEKENTIHMLRKKLKVSSTEHVQTPKLIALQYEKDVIYQEMMSYKGKDLKLQYEKQEWEKKKYELL